MNASGSSGRLLGLLGGFWRWPGDIPFSGRIQIHWHEMVTFVVRLLKGQDLPADLVHKELVFLWIRLPRCLMALLVGSALAMSGAVYQALFRNPLVSPDILGSLPGVYSGRPWA